MESVAKLLDLVMKKFFCDLPVSFTVSDSRQLLSDVIRARLQ